EKCRSSPKKNGDNHDKYDLGLFHDLLVFGAAEMKMAVGVEAD
ncbi:hypothetical protein FOCG_18573, partial [Fusarium oxysporum f. sp. radicis-lycopersici 26381]